MNDDLKGYPKIQWSVFVKNGKDTQYVIRADSEEEFKKLKTFVLSQVAEDLIAINANVHTETKPVVTTQNFQGTMATAQAENSPKCAIHNVPMKERTTKSGGHYFDHRQQLNGVWNTCNGTGWKSQ